MTASGSVEQPQLVGRWRFNATTATPPVSPDDLGTSPATLYGPAAISSDDSALGSAALALDGDTAYAATTGTPLRTDESFTITAWAKTVTPATSDMTVLSLGDGTDSAVTLSWHYIGTYHDPDFPDFPELDIVMGEWRAETVSGGTSRVHTVVAHSPDAGWGSGWTHLALRYDAVAGELMLYVNGWQEDQVCDDDDTSGTCQPHVSHASVDPPFQATSGLQFGRGLVDGAWVQPFSGQLDDVWAYQGVLNQAQIISLGGPGELDTPTGP